MKARDLKRILANVPDTASISFCSGEIREQSVQVVTLANLSGYGVLLLQPDDSEIGAGERVLFNECEGGPDA